MEIKIFNSEKKINIKSNKLVLINELDNLINLYEYEDYYLKVIQDILNINKIYKDLINKIVFIYKFLDKNDDLRKSVEFSLPIGYFLDDGKIFKKEAKNLVLLYKKLNLINLNKFLENEEIFSDKRIKIYQNLIDLLIFFHKNNILICDFKLDNFGILEDNNNLLIIIKNTHKININELKDLKILQTDFILPPETFFKNEYNIYSEIWLSTNLIFYVLTNLNVFDFIKLGNINHNILQKFLYYVDYRIRTWPPVIKKDINIFTQFPYFDQNKYNNLLEICKNYFKYSAFKEILFKNFILGYLLFSQRKNLDFIKNELKKDIFSKKQEIKENNIDAKFNNQINLILNESKDYNPDLETKIEDIKKDQEKQNILQIIDFKNVNEIKNKEFLELNLVKKIEVKSDIVYSQDVIDIHEYLSMKLKEKNINNLKLIEFLKNVFIFIPLDLDLINYYKANLLFDLFSVIDNKEKDIKKKNNFDDKELYYLKVVIVRFIEILDQQNLKKIVNIFNKLYKNDSYEKLIYFVYQNLKKDLLDITNLDKLSKIGYLKDINFKINSFISLKVSEILKDYLESNSKKIKFFVFILVFILSIINVFLFFINLKLFLIFLIINGLFLSLINYWVLKYLKYIVKIS
jgi:hypothetical protein